MFDTDLRDLIEDHQRAQRKLGVRVTISDIAEAAGFTRSFLYLLLAGERGASNTTVASLAEVLNQPKDTIREALGR